MNEEKVIQVNDKKSINGAVVLVLCLLFAIIFGVGGWFLGTKYYESENKENEKETEVVESEKKDEDTEKEVKPEKNSKYTFVKEYTKKHNLNNKDIEVLVYYYKDSESWLYGPSSTDIMNSNVVRMDLFVNGSKMIDSESVLAVVDSKKADEFINTNPHDIIAIDIFKDSSNSNEYYLMNLGKISIVNNIFEERYIYLFTNEGKLLESFKVWNSSGVVGIYGTQDMIGDRTAIKDTNNPERYKLYNYDLVDVHENFIYAIERGATCDSAIEYRYTVEDGKLKSIHSRTFTYEYIEGAGQC